MTTLRFTVDAAHFGSRGPSLTFRLFVAGGSSLPIQLAFRFSDGSTKCSSSQNRHWLATVAYSLSKDTLYLRANEFLRVAHMQVDQVDRPNKTVS